MASRGLSADAILSMIESGNLSDFGDNSDESDFDFQIPEFNAPPQEGPVFEESMVEEHEGAVRMYWSSKFRIPCIRKRMPRNRFMQIRRYLKVTDDNLVPAEVKARDVAWKVRLLLNTVRSGCLRMEWLEMSSPVLDTQVASSPHASSDISEDVSSLFEAFESCYNPGNKVFLAFHRGFIN
ncbi:hypothetical protein WDU94_008940 [Cyamophila willieti]